MNALQRLRVALKDVVKPIEGLLGATALITGVTLTTGWEWGLAAAGGVLILDTVT